MDIRKSENWFCEKEGEFVLETEIWYWKMKLWIIRDTGKSTS